MGLVGLSVADQILTTAQQGSKMDATKTLGTYGLPKVRIFAGHDEALVPPGLGLAGLGPGPPPPHVHRWPPQTPMVKDLGQGAGALAALAGAVALGCHSYPSAGCGCVGVATAMRSGLPRQPHSLPRNQLVG